MCISGRLQVALGRVRCRSALVSLTAEKVVSAYEKPQRAAERPRCGAKPPFASRCSIIDWLAEPAESAFQKRLDFRVPASMHGCARRALSKRG